MIGGFPRKRTWLEACCVVAILQKSTQRLSCLKSELAPPGKRKEATRAVGAAYLHPVELATHPGNYGLPLDHTERG